MLSINHMIHVMRIWKLPYNCHTAIIEHLSGSIAIFDFICNRNLNFIIINMYAIVFFGRMQSGVGRNVQLCCERYGRYMSDLLHMLPKQKLNIKIDKDVENRVGMIKELVMVRDGLMCVYGDRFHVLMFGC